MRKVVVTALAIALAGCGQSRPERVAAAIDWGPVDCKGLVHILHRPITGLGRDWADVADDQAQIECGMEGPAVTWTKFRSKVAARQASAGVIGAPVCLTGREVVVDLFDFGGAANRRAFARTCQHLSGVVRPGP